jgi:hypothetical protein
MLDTLITSKTRIKLLLKFFLNAKTQSYLRGLEMEFGESSNAIRQELNRFEEAGLLVSENKGNRKYFQANVRHALFPEIHSLIMKYTGVDKIVENVVGRLGDLQTWLVTLTKITSTSWARKLKKSSTKKSGSSFTARTNSPKLKLRYWENHT